MNTLPSLFFQKYRFSLSVTSPMMLPPYKGSTFRGGMLSDFKREICLRSYSNKCEECPLCEHCSYYFLFESSQFASSHGVSMPYIIEPPLTERRMFDVGDILTFSVVLIGKAIDYYKLLILAVKRLGETSGLGRRIDGQRGKFLLEHVESVGVSDNSVIIYSAEHGFQHDKPITVVEDDVVIHKIDHQDGTHYTLQFLTPVRFIVNVDKRNDAVLKHVSFEHGRNKKRLVTNFDFAFLIRELLRRLSRLSEAYCDGHRQDYSDIIEQASNIRTTKSLLHRHDLERYSSRQKVRHPMDGIKGFLRLEGNLGFPFLPYLRLGEWLHLGKKTTFGLGQCQLPLPKS